MPPVRRESDAARTAADRHHGHLAARGELDDVDLRSVLGTHVQPASVGRERRVFRILALGRNGRGQLRRGGVVACELDGTVHVIDAHTHRPVAQVAAGAFANGVTVAPDGKRVYVSSGRGASVSVIDTATRAVIATVGVGQRPWNMALTPDGAKLYVANGRSNTVSVIDTARLVKVADVPVGQAPWGVAIR